MAAQLAALLVLRLPALPSSTCSLLNHHCLPADFREATCRQYEENSCSRGGYCNFMHVRPVSRELRKQVRPVGQEAVGVAMSRAQQLLAPILLLIVGSPHPTPPNPAPA